MTPIDLRSYVLTHAQVWRPGEPVRCADCQQPWPSHLRGCQTREALEALWVMEHAQTQPRAGSGRLVANEEEGDDAA